MRIGMSICSSYTGVSAKEGARMMVERARASRNAELDSLFVGDHHVTPMSYYQNSPILGRMLAEWGDRPFGALYLLPLWHPVLLAEQVSTLAAIGDGRFILQCGLGDHRSGGAMGIDMSKRVAMFEESLRIIRRLWKGEKVSASNHWKLDAVRIAPQPEETIDVWVGAVADPAIERAARLAEGWLASPALTPEQAGIAAQYYQSACAEHGRTSNATAIRRDLYIGATSQQARDVVAPYVEGNYRGIKEEALLFGSPAEVEDKIGRLAELGFTDICARNICAEQNRALETIERLGEIRVSFEA